ncbi:MAG: htpX [Symbiobacteriaceae bacterium]|nr:htpX [Symbiobacteriaceae bacterium]
MDWVRHVVFRWVLAAVYFGLIFSVILLFPAILRPWVLGLYVIVAFFTWWNSHTRVARNLELRPLTNWDVPDLPRFRQDLARAMEAAGVRREPYFAVYTQRVPNAMAIGGRRAIVVFTTGALKHLTQDELLAVAAHELRHVASNDMLPGLLGGAWLRMLWQIATFLIHAGNAQGGVLSAVAAVCGGVLDLALRIVGWAASVSMAQRSRFEENQADLLGARVTSAETVVSALEKLERVAAELGHVQEKYAPWSTAWIAQRLHASHPSLAARRQFLADATERGDLRAS